MIRQAPPGYDLVFADEFDGDELDPRAWLPFYLPHWSKRERTVPRYAVADSCLTLRIDRDQPAWCPEFDGAVKVSNVQTGHFSGPLGSGHGQHRFSPDLVVRDELPPQKLFLSQYGRFEVRAKADISANNLVALWLIGFEDVPERSGELCVVEIKGWQCEEDSTSLGYGIKPWYDPALKPEFYEDRLSFGVAEFHTYALDWSPDGVDVYLDGKPLRRLTQSPAYPMQMMLNIYELPAMPSTARGAPASLAVDYVRVWREAGSGSAIS